MGRENRFIGAPIVRSKVTAITGVTADDLLGYVVIAVKNDGDYQVVSNAGNDEAIIATLGDVISSLGQELANARLGRQLN